MNQRSIPLMDALIKCDSGEWGADPSSNDCIPVLRVADINRNNTISYSSAPKRSIPHSKMLEKTLQNGDILVVKSSGSATNVVTGRVARVSDLDDQTVGFSNFLVRLRVNPELYESKYLFHILRSPQVRHFVLAMVSGSTYPNLSLPRFREMDIPLVALPQQRKIAQFVEAACEDIAAAKDNMERNVVNCHNLFRSHLDSVFNNNTTLGGKSKVQTRALREVLSITKGRKPSLHPIRKNGDIPYLVAKVLRGTQEPEWASKNDPKVVTVEAADTIIICDGSNSGEVFSGFNGALSSTMAKVRPSIEINQDYLRWFLESKADLFAGAKTGAAIPHLDQELLFSLQIPLPPVNEQRDIADGLHTLKAKMLFLSDIYKRKTSALERLEKAMFHQVYSGELKVV